MRQLDTPLDWINRGPREDKLAFSRDYIISKDSLDPIQLFLIKNPNMDSFIIDYLNNILGQGDSGKLYFRDLRSAWNKKSYDRKNKGNSKQLVINKTAKLMLAEMSMLKQKSNKKIVEDLITLAYQQKDRIGDPFIHSDFMYSPISQVDEKIRDLVRKVIYIEKQKHAIKSHMLLHVEKLLEYHCRYDALSEYFSEKERNEIFSSHADDIARERKARYEVIRKSIDAADRSPAGRRLFVETFNDTQGDVSKMLTPETVDERPQIGPFGHEPAPEQTDSKMPIGEYPPPVEPVEPVVSESTATISKVMERPKPKSITLKFNSPGPRPAVARRKPDTPSSE